MVTPYVLDACALVAVLNEEAGAEKVRGIFRQAVSGETTLVMNKLNLLEVYYGLRRVYGKERADTFWEEVRQSPITVISEITDEVFEEAGRLKASHRISLADSIALAEAAVSGGALMTSDHHEFDAIQKTEPITFYWIR